jgi:hypothetical protein
MQQASKPLWSLFPEQEKWVSVSIDNPQVQDISAKLHRAVAESGDQTLWLAMDGSDRPLPEIDGIDWTQRESIDVRLRHPEIDPQWWPRWFALHLDRPMDANILNHSIFWALEEAAHKNVRAGLGRRVSGWFMTVGGPIQAAAQHWARLMLRRSPHAPGQRLLRLHDPAVLWAVWQTLPAGLKGQCLGPVSHWHLIDPLGELSQLESPARSGEETGSPLPFELSGQQWQDVQNITPLHLAMQRIVSSSQTTSAEYRQRFLEGLSALRRANSHRLTDLHSLSLFAELALTRHTLFDQHPELQRLLKHREAGEPLGGLLSDLTELDWQRLIADIEQQPHSA